MHRGTRSRSRLWSSGTACGHLRGARPRGSSCGSTVLPYGRRVSVTRSYSGGPVPQRLISRRVAVLSDPTVSVRSVVEYLPSPLGTAELAALVRGLGTLAPAADDGDRIDRIRALEELKS